MAIQCWVGEDLTITCKTADIHIFFLPAHNVSVTCREMAGPRPLLGFGGGEYLEAFPNGGSFSGRCADWRRNVIDSRGGGAGYPVRGKC